VSEIPHQDEDFLDKLRQAVFGETRFPKRETPLLPSDPPPPTFKTLLYQGETPFVGFEGPSAEGGTPPLHEPFAWQIETSPGLAAIAEAAESGEIDAAVEAVFDRAAVVGFFDPNVLVDDVEPSRRQAALSALVPVCDVAKRKKRRCWILYRGPRRERLSALWADRPRLETALQASRPMAGDHSGALLWSILRSQELPALPRSAGRMRAYLQVLDWVAAVLPGQVQEAAVRRSLARLSIRDSFDRLLKDGFFGREDAVARFEEFLAKPASGDLPVLAITGIGGSGKSTFLAHVAAKLLRDTHADSPITIAIDFDRRGLGPNSILELTFEVTRQIALFEPALTQPFKDLRRHLRRQALDQLGGGTDTPQEYVRSVGDRLWRYGVSQLRSAGDASGLRQRDIILLLDTFEELQSVRAEEAPGSSGAAASSRIGEWLEELVRSAQLERLKAVVSGRAVVEPHSVLGQHVVQTIDLAELDPPDRVHLLQRLNTPPEIVDDLAATIGGNPLILRIGARLIARLNQTERAEVLADVAVRGRKLGTAFVQGFLYDRVLRHIGDKRVQRLAHPGLVLRRVTWRLIRDVLAGPCGLAEVSEETAKELLGALADEVWLVERRGKPPGSVLVHRRDIRRIMLHLMAADQGETAAADSPDGSDSESFVAKIREIQELAVNFYARFDDPDTDETTARQERCYHALMLDAVPPADEEIRLVGPTLGEDIELVPQPLRARVKLVLEASLADEDIDALPEEAWFAFAFREGRARLVEQDDPVGALQILSRRPLPAAAVPGWYWRALDAAARWRSEEAAALDRLVDSDSTRAPPAANANPQTQRMLMEDLLDKASAIALLRFKRAEYEAAFATALDFLEDQSLFTSHFKYDATQGTALMRCLNYARLALAAAAPSGSETAADRWHAAEQSIPIADLATASSHVLNAELQRFMALSDQAARRRPLSLRATSATFVPDPEWLEQVIALEGKNAASGLPLRADLGELHAFASDFAAKLREGCSSSELLGPVAVAFAQLYERQGGIFLGGDIPTGFDPRLLRGDNPEFRPSARFALLAAFPEPRHVAELAEIAWSLLPARATDLAPTQLAATTARGAISQLVDYVDSSHRLGQLLVAAQRARPTAEALALTAEAFGRWEEAFEACMAEPAAALARPTVQHREEPMANRTWQAKSFLERIMPAGGVETLRAPSAAQASLLEGLVSPEHNLVRSTLDKVAAGRELSPPEQFALEAIIIPDQRPAIDIVDGDFTVTHPLWQHFAADPIKPQIKAALSSIGRVEVFGIPNLPYGGTGFVVGPGIIMTNRHVAGLFATGLGRSNIAFATGLGSGIDFKRERDRAEKQFLQVRRVLMIHPYWDMALLQVEGLSEDHPPLALSLDMPESLAGRDVAVIGYPAFDPRNPADVQNKVFGGVYYVKRLQPGKLGGRRQVDSFNHAVSAMTHDASTLGGNSGSAVFDPSSGSIVALHFAGAYLDANFTVPAWELARDRYVIASGVVFRGAAPVDGAATREWWSSIETAPASRVPVVSTSTAPAAAKADASDPRATPSVAGDGMTWTIPLQVTVRLGVPQQGPMAAADVTAAGEALTERPVAPVRDPDYSNRTGYAADFLGINVPLPEILDEQLCAPLKAGGGHLLNYHHFSLVMHRQRRLAMLTAANFDGSPARKKPDKRQSYSRNALGGLGPNDTELWSTDPRLEDRYQLPDRFFNKDRGAFDRGHIVRREDVAWGDTYDEVRFANGDTFHTTNCSPQVKGFNQSAQGVENWGDLENFITAQGRGDRVILFAGPVLAENDAMFFGQGDQGTVRVQIPQQYWKLVVAEEAGQLRAFAFLLRQDLGNVPLEFAVDAVWQQHMVAIDDLEELLGIVRFPEVVRRADQAGTGIGESVRRLARINLLPTRHARGSLVPPPPIAVPQDSPLARIRGHLAAAQRRGSLAYIAEFDRAPPADLADRASTIVGSVVGVEPVFRADRRFMRLVLPGVDPQRLGESPFELVEPLRQGLGARSIEPDIATDFFPERPEPGPGAEAVQESTELMGCWVNDSEPAPADRAWALRNMRIPEAWQLAEQQGRPSQGEGILIAQPDTGVTDHPELQNAMDRTRWADLLDGGEPIDPLVQDDPLDNPGHGTGTGSVVISRGSVEPTSTGGPGLVTGSAPAARLVPIRCIESVIRITQSRVARAIEHAVDSGCHVVTMSLGGLWSSSLAAAVERAIDNNLIVLAAAGNCVRLVVWPARFERCIAVAGSNVHDTTWRGSCRGSAVDISAPAQHVWRASRKPGEGDPAAVGAGEGTSFAVALTAGVAAMWLAHHGRQRLIESLASGERLQDRFIRVVKRTARVPEGWDAANFGSGILDARALLAAGIGAAEAPFEGVQSFSAGSSLAGDQASAARHVIEELGGGTEAIAGGEPELLERHGLELIWLAFERERRRSRPITEAAPAALPVSERLRLALSRPQNIGVALHLGLALDRAEEFELPTPNSGDDTEAEPGSERIAPLGDAVEAPVSWRVAKSLLALRRVIDSRAPHRSKASDGTIGDAAHASRSSDHNPWVKDGPTGVVTAMDITHDPAGGCDAGKLAESIRASRDPRVKYIIWNRQITSSTVAPWTWRPYSGENPHTKHVHISVLPEKAQCDSEATWVI